MGGFILDAPKAEPPTTIMEVCCATPTMRPDCADASIPERRQSDHVSDLKDFLEKGRLAPAQSDLIRCRLVFTQSLAFARVGRSLLAPFSDRQYTLAQGTRYPLNGDLADSMKWRISVAGGFSPRRLFCAPCPPVLLYTDDTGSGRMSDTCFYNGAGYR